MMLETPQYEKGQLYQISIVDFRPDPNQPRKSMDPQALAELADSIKSVGVLQPLLFRVGIGGHDPISPPPIPQKLGSCPPIPGKCRNPS